ncbi:expressed unknown protein [Seminavis robusta]|uniref:Transmembrane protein n=1 Tax=Seminavis robusta TaxID=568900 RepID=A0A9N8EXD6_9STRA|nr:expressed unknown protein [Seminavis robusta]|eukprot:Sro2248_g320690.1 n/a (336) ;mRNA; r:7561-8787
MRSPEHIHNSTITTSVSIRVTPVDDFLVSWSVLWGCFVLTSIVAAYQVWADHKITSNRQDDIENGRGGMSGDEGVSTADVTRSMFRRWLFLAMLARVILMPVQIWANPLVWQFVSDTLPEMIFASAWTLLVSFFVQLVGVASGSGTSTSPGTVIQITAYIVYLLLVGLFFVNNVASVLLYALLCCIYAALFGTCVYFCPRLLILLKPSLQRYSGLAIRLAICSFLCVAVFVSHTIGYAVNIVAPPRKVYWWWNYGALELIPSALFLLLMHPNPGARASSASTQQPSNNGNKATTTSGAGFRRIPSSAGSARRSGETTPLYSQSPAYGSAVADAAS